MKPIELPEHNVCYGAKQAEYNPLSAFRDKDGKVISCWEFDEIEWESLKKSKKIYLTLHTFNAPLQPVLLSVFNPVITVDIQAIMKDAKNLNEKIIETNTRLDGKIIAARRLNEDIEQAIKDLENE